MSDKDEMDGYDQDTLYKFIVYQGISENIL